MKLTGNQIQREMSYGNIEIEPFDKSRINPNSYNLMLGNKLKVYNSNCIDVNNPDSMKTTEIIIHETGYRLEKNQFYLGHTVERTHSKIHAPLLEGRSSIGRLGLFVHVSAGFGDVGFNGQWTLELYPVMSIVVYPYMEICQIAFHEVRGKVTGYDGNYQGQSGVVESRYKGR